MTLYYAQSSGSQSTNSANWTPIPGLTITIPEGVGESALVIVNLPLPYATGSNYPGINLGITVNGTLAPVTGGFTYNDQQPQSTGRVPTTLVQSVALSGQGAQTVVAVWSGVRGSTAIIDSPATLSAIV